MKRSLPIVPAMLAALSLGLVVMLGVQAIWPAAKAPPSVPGAALKTSAAATRAPFAPPQVEDFKALQDRPPFSSTRRQGPVADAAAETDAAPPPDAALLGIIAADKGRIAVLRLAGSNEVMNLSSGDDIQGWEIAEVEDERLILVRGDKSHEIWLDGARERAAAGDRRGIVQLRVDEE